MYRLFAIIFVFLSCCSCSMSLSAPTIIIPTITPTITPLTKSSLENAPKTITATVSTSLHIRASGSVSAKIVDYLSKGDEVIVYECKQGWARINQDTIHPNWVNSSYLSESCK